MRNDNNKNNKRLANHARSLHVDLASASHSLTPAPVPNCCLGNLVNLGSEQDPDAPRSDGGMPADAGSGTMPFWEMESRREERLRRPFTVRISSSSTSTLPERARVKLARLKLARLKLPRVPPLA